jgi:sensor histidine kinase regulating citrate/malate metabolism
MKIQDNSSHKTFVGKENITMGLDLENTSSIMNLLRNNIYTDPIDSIVREYFSNAIDAQARVNSSASIELNIEDIDDNYIFTIRDFGGSMDKETIANVYAKMGKSDKRNNNNEHGG